VTLEYLTERVFHTLKNESGSVHVARDGLQLEQILSGRLFHILLKSPLKNTNFSPTYADDLQALMA